MEIAATIVGTSGDDVIRGTDGPDVVAGLGGNDRIWGLGGDTAGVDVAAASEETSQVEG